MALKRKTYTPQEYIRIGMAFFLIGFCVSRVADGQMIGALLGSLIPDKSITNTFQDIAVGFSIPISCASIYFNLRGLSMLRSK